ncbi:snRNA-activating protein of 50kDa MW C terminal-domain-containing protein [Flammula alnicola]|nr:snRNA-activating protein of 50kDa MW C terminal-domain-containing protein [Flammula alnicola]
MMRSSVFQSTTECLGGQVTPLGHLNMHFFPPNLYRTYTTQFHVFQITFLQRQACRRRSGCAICIEGIVYGNGGHNDYARVFVQKIHHTHQKSTYFLEGTKLCSLSLCLNEPYWLIHQGNCEHFVVIDQISRLLHPSDPRSGYPLTLQITPPILDLCRACARVPAIWSIVADVRLGESPCVLCGPCWRNMGEYGMVSLYYRYPSIHTTYKTFTEEPFI